MVADIVNPGRRTPRGCNVSGSTTDEARYYTSDVIDMGEVAAHPAMVKKPNRLAFNDRPCERENRHIGTSPRPVDGEESQSGNRQPVEMAVGVSHQLVCSLGRSVKADRVI